MGQKKETPATSGIQVLDRAIHILQVIAAKPRNLTELCEETGLPRATAHRISVALEKHRLIERQGDSHWTAGAALAELAPSTSARLEDAASHLLPELVSRTGESVQIYRISGTERVCIAAAEPAAGLRDTVPVGSRMTLTAGSAAKVLVAWSSPTLQAEILPHASFTPEELAAVRSAGVAESVAERDPSLASASVPLIDANDHLLGALSVSGPVARMGESPGRRFGATLKEMAINIESHL